jgi:2-polyprenyl-6-methoxyphenol hydroxylase-like FAD-dependent oxidoreductase
MLASRALRNLVDVQGGSCVRDVIVVGARCAGSPTAMLLAQLGYRVLLLDRASFPSDTVSTHLVTLPGVARLDRWGLLGRVAASGCPPISRMTVRLGDVRLVGSPSAVDGVAGQYCVRRTTLDTILVEAALEAGAELREGFVVREVLFDGARVVGVRGRGPNGVETVERASLVVGADGVHSAVAEAVQARRYAEALSLTWCCYAYWAGVALEGAEMHISDRRAFCAFPTNDDLVCLSVAWPAAEARQFRSDVEGNFIGTLEARAPRLAGEVRNGQRVRPFVGTADLPNFFREASGPGWALVGDAGHHQDPLLAAGIAGAFRDAELLAEAIDAGLGGGEVLGGALAGYEERRNRAAMPGYELNARLASLDPPPDLVQRAREASASQAETDRFLGVLCGSVPVGDAGDRSVVNLGSGGRER